MKVAYLSSAYLSPVEYYSKLLNYDKIFIEQHDHSSVDASNSHDPKSGYLSSGI